MRGVAAPEVLGYVLAGGESSRMQQADAPRVDKALLILEGETLLERALRTVATVCPGPRVLCGPEHRCMLLRAHGDTVPDRYNCAGPVGALEAALHDAAGRGGAWVLLLPVDLPWMTADLLNIFAQHARSRGAAPACMRNVDGIQPLPCIVQCTALPAVMEALERRDYKLLPMLRAIAGGEPVVFDLPVEENGRAFWNINTPAEYQSAQNGETAESSLHQSKHGRRAAGN